jgi:hypothetical protein
MSKNITGRSGSKESPKRRPNSFANAPIRVTPRFRDCLLSPPTPIIDLQTSSVKYSCKHLAIGAGVGYRHGAPLVLHEPFRGLMSRPGSRCRCRRVARFRSKTTKLGTRSRLHGTLPASFIPARPGDFNYTECRPRGFSMKSLSSSGILSNVCPIGRVTPPTPPGGWSWKLGFAARVGPP